MGGKWGTVSCGIYLLLGLVGVPVFSGFSGGMAKLLGPTGGYLVGFLLLAVISGLFVEKFEQARLPVASRYGAWYACGLSFWYALACNPNEIEFWSGSDDGGCALSGWRCGEIDYCTAAGKRIAPPPTSSADSRLGKTAFMKHHAIVLFIPVQAANANLAGA